MAYQAIYRKWRPTVFEDVVGQSHITETLKTEIKTDKLAHAYLFCGTRGTGKTTTAKILSRAVNCEALLPNGNPCNECPSCKGILSGTIMDVVEIDAASNNGVDNIRELRDEISYTPANVKYKIYIIDEVHMLSTGAFNALLKTLEEPPSHAIFILATTEPHKIPATIQSRCQRFDFRRISAKNIAGRIGEITRKDGIKIASDAVDLVAQLGDGSMRDALSILDLCSGIEGEITRDDIENVTGAISKTELVKLSRALITGDISTCIILIGKMLDNGREVSVLIDELIMTFREILMCKIMQNPIDVIDKSERDIEIYKDIAEGVSKDTILHIIKVLSETSVLCKSSTNPRVITEAATVKICDPATDPSTEAFASRIGKLEIAISSGLNVTKAVAEDSVVSNTSDCADTPDTADNVPDEKYEESPKSNDDDEEYTFEEDVFEEDIPPFEISAPTSDFNQPTLIEADIFNQQNVTETADEPSNELAEEHTDTLTEEANTDLSEGESTFNISLLVDAMMPTNPALGSILKEAELKTKNGAYYIVFNEAIFKNTIKDNKDFVNGILSVLKSDSVKIVTKDEFHGNKSKDNFEDLISASDSIDQINIFE